MAYARKSYRRSAGSTGGRRTGARRTSGNRRRVSRSAGGSRAVRIELVVPGMSASRPFEVPVGPAKRSRF